MQHNRAGPVVRRRRKYDITAAVIYYCDIYIYYFIMSEYIIYIYIIGAMKRYNIYVFFRRLYYVQSIIILYATDDIRPCKILYCTIVIVA